MERRLALLRLILCYTLCVCICALSVYSIITNKKPPLADNLNVGGFWNENGGFGDKNGGFEGENTIFSDNELVFQVQSPNFTAQENSSNQTTNSPQNNLSQSVTSSLPASTGAVKGNVIEKYISPYTAKLSYNGVYMKNSTSLSINIKNLLASKLSFKIEKNTQPQVLIVHTHTTETFLENDAKTYGVNHSSRTTDNNKNMAAVGAIIAKKLNDAGIKTLHDKTQHDYPQYNGSYGRSAKTVNSYLKKYKSIKIVLDLHRDSVTVSGNDKAKLVTKINGKKAAQVMLVMGSQSGSIKNHPNWQENLKLAVKLQQTMENKYPTLARPMVVASKNYNQSLSKGALLMEFGTDMNSLDEVKYSAELVANSLISLLNTIK